MRYCMLDIETLGNGPKAVVIQLAAIIFESDKSILNEQGELRSDVPMFCQSLTIEDQVRLGREINGETIKFWTTMPELLGKILNAAQLASIVLYNFHAWYKEHKPEAAFCYGATFDHVILSSLYHDLRDHTKNPVSYRDQLDMRTIVRMTQVKCPVLPSWIQNHNAIDDCIRQVIWIQECFKFVTQKA